MAKFRDGQAKCYVMQDAARQITNLGEASTSSCYMRRVDASSGTRLITYVSGDEVTQGEFFTVGSDTVYRQLNLENMPALQGGSEKIIFELQGSSVESNVYQITLNFCDANSNTIRSKEVIRVDNGSALLSIANTFSGSHTYNSETINYSHNIALTAGLIQGSDGSTSFDPSATRTMTIKSQDTSSSSSFSSNGSLSVASGTLTAKFRYKGAGTYNSQTFSFDEKSASIVSYTGSNTTDVAIAEGAGSRQGSFTNGSQSPFDFEDDIIFEYNEGQSPRYTTAASTSLSTTLAAIDFSTDAILSQTDPEAPTALPDSSICSQAVSSVYSLDMSSAGIAEVQTACENRFSDGDRICDAIRDVEDQIWAKLNERNNAG